MSQLIQYTCRACGTRLSDERSCEACEAFKARYLSVETIESEDEPDLLATADEAVSMLRGIGRRLAAELREKPKYDANLARAAQVLAKATACLLDSVRKLQESGEDVLASLSVTERTSLIVEWLAELPPTVRANALKKIGVYVPSDPKPRITLS